MDNSKDLWQSKGKQLLCWSPQNASWDVYVQPGSLSIVLMGRIRPTRRPGVKAHQASLYKIALLLFIINYCLSFVYNFCIFIKYVRKPNVILHINVIMMMMMMMVIVVFIIILITLLPLLLLLLLLLL